MERTSELSNHTATIDPIIDHTNMREAEEVQSQQQQQQQQLFSEPMDTAAINSNTNNATATGSAGHISPQTPKHHSIENHNNNNNNNNSNDTVMRTRNVYVSGLPPHFRSNDFRSLCQQFGRVEASKLCIDGSTTPTKGYGFALFYSSESASACIAGLNGTFLSGRCLQARLADAAATPQPMSGSGSPNDNARNSPQSGGGARSTQWKSQSNNNSPNHAAARLKKNHNNNNNMVVNSPATAATLSPNIMGMSISTPLYSPVATASTTDMMPPPLYISAPPPPPPPTSGGNNYIQYIPVYLTPSSAQQQQQQHPQQQQFFSMQPPQAHMQSPHHHGMDVAAMSNTSNAHMPSPAMWCDANGSLMLLPPNMMML